MNKYEKLGADYHWKWMSSSPENPYGKWVKQVLGYLPDPSDGATILDFGCGDGYPAYLMGAAGWNVTGYDVYAPAMDVARSKSAAFPNVSIVDRLPDTAFDYVLALEVLEHVDDPAPLVRAVQACKYAIVTTPPPGVDKYAERAYTPADVKELFAGCEVETLHTDEYHQAFKVTPGAWEEEGKPARR